ncbi:MAG: elongation factor P [Candidatus Levybacteria bacterium]|nr:elongation factor P [Candidatus Levybacteria bacterium]
MIGVTELRNGSVYEDQGDILIVLSYEHIKMGRGSANIKVKVKNVRNGATLIKSFINGARVNNLQIAKKDVQFLYKDDTDAYFMNPITFEQLTIPLTVIGEHEYLKEGHDFNVSFLGDEALSITFPPKMEFTIADTGPSLRGNSATNIYKDAVLDNGLKIRVPLFSKIGDRIRIDTRTGEYSEKVQ